MHSRTDYSVFEGMRLNGGIEKVFLRGRLTAQKCQTGIEIVEEGRGMFVPGELPIDNMEAPV